MFILCIAFWTFLKLGSSNKNLLLETVRRWHTLQFVGISKFGYLQFIFKTIKLFLT